jgi:choline-sulfatase
MSTKSHRPQADEGTGEDSGRTKGSLPPPMSMPPPPETGWAQPLGDAAALGLLVALVCAFPTALRAKSEGGSMFGAWLVGLAILLPVAWAFSWLLRSSGRAFRALARVGVGLPTDAPRALPRARIAALGLALWIGLSVPPWVALGAALKAVTHHRGLGGAAFGVVGLALSMGALVVARRLTELGRAWIERGHHPWAVFGGLGGAALLPTTLAVAPLFGAGSDAGGGGVLAALVDGSIGAVALALSASVDLPAAWRRVARFAAPPAAAGLVVLGVASATPEHAAAMSRGGGLAAAMLHALERWSDRDGDGFGAHFGGGDCDEGDPTRHPGAVDPPEDGVDQDCADGEPQHAVSVRPAPTDAEAAGGSPAAPETADAPDPEDGPAPGATPAKPHLVLVTLDTVRADRTSAYGYGKATTPHLAQIAEHGVLFERAYTTGSDTQRALMPLVSGTRFSRTPRGGGLWPSLGDDADTLAERLKRAGYTTGAVSSFTWLRKDKGFAQGFDRFEEAFTEDHPERGVTGDDAVAAVKTILADWQGVTTPTFLWVHLFDAHERYLEHAGIDFGKSKSGLYDGEIAFVDARLGEIWDAVAATGRGKDTAWVVHGSHGEGLAEHEFWGHGRELYEEAVWVPLVVVTPGLERGATVGGAAVSTGDIPSTLLALAGADSAGVEGSSLTPMVRWARGRAAEEAAVLPDEVRRGPVYIRAPRRAVLIDWPLKLMRKFRDEGKEPRHLLFDLAADPGEKSDLSKERTLDLERLKKLLDEREREADESGDEGANDPADKREL